MSKRPGRKCSGRSIASLHWAASRDKISVGDILRTLEGDLAPVNCSEVTENGVPCKESDQCITKIVWKRIGDSINHAVDNLMLSDLLDGTDL